MSDEYAPILIDDDDGDIEYDSYIDVDADDIVYFTSDEDSGDGTLRDVLRSATSNAVIAPIDDLFYNGEVVIYLTGPLTTNWHGRNIIAGRRGKIRLIGDGTFAVTGQYGSSYIARGVYEDIIFEDFHGTTSIGILGSAARFSEGWTVNRCMFLNCDGTLIRNTATTASNAGVLSFVSCLFVNTGDKSYTNRVYCSSPLATTKFIGCTASDTVTIGTQGSGSLNMADTLCAQYYLGSLLKKNTYTVEDVCVNPDNMDFRVKKDNYFSTGATIEKTGYDFIVIEQNGVFGAIGAVDGNFMTTVFGDKAEIALYAMDIATPSGTDVPAFG